MRLLDLDQVWWLVSPQNPLKPVQGMAPLDARMAAARRVADHPAIAVTAIESGLGTRYTAETVAALSRRFPRPRFGWLMGADNQIGRAAWRDRGGHARSNTVGPVIVQKTKTHAGITCAR